MIKFLPVLVFTLLLSQSCRPAITKNEVWKNDKIEAKTRATLESLDKQVYGYMCDNNYEPLSQLFSDTLLSRITPEFSQKFMPQIQHVIKGRQYRIFDEFYIRHIKPLDTVDIAAGNGDSAYSLKFIAAERETYIAMLVAGDSLNQVMITLVCSNINGKWKISNLLGEDYSLNNKCAIAQYHYAKAMEQSGDLMDAVNIMALEKHCNTPGGNFFSYSCMEGINKYSDSLTNITKARYPFPYRVNELATKPSVFNLHYEVTGGHFAPMIMYRSSINVADTVALEKENKEMQKNIGTIFSGMDKNNSSILYRAYNDVPDGRNSPRYYGYVQNLK